MFNQSARDTNKSAEPPRTHAGPPPDSECAQPPLPEPIYKPFGQTTLDDDSYKPYSEKAALPDPPYEPYKGI